MTVNANIQDFPEVDDGAIKVYGEKPYENALAALTHKLHRIQYAGKYFDNDRVEILRLIRDYFNFKKIEEATSDEYMSMVADNPFGTDVFQEFFDVPFKSPKNPKFTFIDLFAGIGGIRLPFTKLGYDCVFSSERDPNAQKTYMANFGEMPFGDITKESVKRYIPQSFDLLLAGFPCQAFSIMGKIEGLTT